MRLKNITATPHPMGNRIILCWKTPEVIPDNSEICIVRREDRYPNTLTDGDKVVIANLTLIANKEYEIIDPEIKKEKADKENTSLLKGETVYYYTLFVSQNGGVKEFDRYNCTAAMATSPYNLGGQMYELLPDIYHRFDTTETEPAQNIQPDALEQTGELRRFLELPGQQLDQFYNFAKALLELHNLDKVDGRLLPLLAHWIGWSLDQRQGYDIHRHQIKGAPYQYQKVGTRILLEQILRRYGIKNFCIKEFIHNVFISNRPPQLNLWSQPIDNSSKGELLSLDFAYEGRPTTVTDGDTVWLFYHTMRNDGYWSIWYKTWTEQKGWTDSHPLIQRNRHDRHPSAVKQGNKLWVFWDSYDETTRTWQIDYCQRKSNGNWDAINTYREKNDTPHVNRQRPWAIVDEQDCLWLFWLEQMETHWQLKYNRYKNSKWEFTSDVEIHFKATEQIVDQDFFVLYQTKAQTGTKNPKLWLFWCSKNLNEGNNKQIRYCYANPNSMPLLHSWSGTYPDHYTFSSDQDKNIRWKSGPLWSDSKSLGQATNFLEDCEPAAQAMGTKGEIEVFWSCFNRTTGKRSIWQCKLNNADTNCTINAKKLTTNSYTQRTPLPVTLDKSVLIYRSNESMVYEHESAAGVTQTIDARYAGCLTFDKRQKLMPEHQVKTYSYADPNKQLSKESYTGNTVGIYVDTLPSTPVQEEIKKLLKPILPISVQIAFFKDKKQLANVKSKITTKNSQN
jgi:hypothetical protein